MPSRLTWRGAFATAAAVFCTWLSPSISTAQGPATVTGLVSSSDGVPLPLALVRVTHRATGATASTTSGELGTYRVALDTTGSFDLVVSAPGFAVVTVPLELAAGERLIRDVVLAVAPLTESLVVSARAADAGMAAAEVRESGAKDVGEALAREVGVSKVRKAAIANDVVVRGLQSRDLNVLVDGERIHGACPNRMDPPAFHVDFAEVERIEVAKGPMDVRFQGSLGGVVNVVTRAPGSGWHAAATVAAGSFEYVAPSATVSFGNRRVAALAGGSFRRAAPYDDGDGVSFLAPANYLPSALDEDAFRARTLWGRTVWTPAEGHRVQASYARQDTDRVAYPYLQMDAVYDDADRANVWYDLASAGPLSGVRAQAYWTRVTHWMTDEWRRTATGAPRSYSMGTQADTRTYGGRLEAGVAGITVGVEASRRWWNTSTALAGAGYVPQASIPAATIDAYGAFAEHTRAVHPRVTLEVGGRLDVARSESEAGTAANALYFAYHGVRATRTSDLLPAGKVRVSWQPATSLAVTAGLGHTARVAEGNERFFALRRMGSDWVGNPQLAPARNTGADVSLAWRRPGVTASADLFANWIDGFVTVYDQVRVNTVPGVMNTKARSYANVDATLTGAELRAEITPVARVFVTADVAVLRGSQEARPEIGIESTRLPEMPPVVSHLRLRFDDGRLFAAAEATWAADQDRVNTDLQESTTPGYGVLDVRAGVRHRGLTATLGVANVLGRTYAEHLSYYRDPFRLGVRVNEPGRSVFVNVAARF
jgi:iron complex outermembrane receptor protein